MTFSLMAPTTKPAIGWTYNDGPLDAPFVWSCCGHCRVRDGQPCGLRRHTYPCFYLGCEGTR